MSSQKKEYRGKWAGLTAIKVSGLAGCSVSKMKRILYKFKGFEKLSLEEQEEVVGRVIKEVRVDAELKKIRSLLR